jgi:hypothetical protein
LLQPLPGVDRGDLVCPDEHHGVSRAELADHAVGRRFGEGGIAQELSEADVIADADLAGAV